MENKTKNKSKNGLNQGGFSFIESMLSVAVLSLGIIAIFPLFTSGLSESFDSRDQIIASMLAQEGAEIVQNIRDNNWASGELTFGSALGNRDDCTVDYNNTDITSTDDCNGAELDHYRLWFSGTLGYRHNNVSGAATRFQRKIELHFAGTAPDPLTLTATSMVIWAGEAFPTTIADCNTKSKCAHVELELSEWGGH